MSDFSLAPEVKAIAADLIPKYHDHLSDPRVRIDYLFADKPKKTKGKEALGWVQMVSNLPAFLAEPPRMPTTEEEEANPDAAFRTRGQALAYNRGEPFFVMCIHRGVWRFALSDKQKIALVDHELCHLWVEENEKTAELTLSTLPHDIEEFTKVIVRHGRWLEDVDKFLKAAARGPQLTLDEIAERPRSGNSSVGVNGSGNEVVVTISHDQNSVTLDGDALRRFEAVISKAAEEAA